MKNRTIVLTGASRGVGFEAAKLLLAQGARILGLGRDPQHIGKATKQLSKLGEFHGLVLDVSQPIAAVKTAEWVNKNWGALDALVNNAGIMHYTPDFEHEDVSVLEQTLATNLLGPHQMIAALVPYLKKGHEPRIVNVASGAGTARCVHELKDMPSYRLSKYALNALTTLWATTLAGQVAVNSLDPGWLKTDMGGPAAPGEPIEGGQRVVKILEKPFSATGKFWHGADEIAF